MRCKACDRILEESELTRKDVHGDFLDLCGGCLSAGAVGSVENEEVVQYYQHQLFTRDDDYDTLF